MMNDRIDLNQADVATLATLPGIGEALAQRIVAYRETVHPFEEVIELAAVPGISERMVRALEERVTVAATDLITPGPDYDSEREGEEVEAPAPAATAAVEAENNEEESEPMIESEPPEPQPEPTIPPSRPAAVERRSLLRGCLFLFLGAILGAVAGTMLTLAILAALNGGTLFFAQADAQLQRDLNDARQAHTDLAGEVNTLTGRVGVMATRAGETAAQQQEMDEMIGEVERNVAGAQAGVDALEETAGELDDRLSTVAESAENFDAFLDSLRDLLVDLQGLPPTPTPTATLPSPTPLATATPAATVSPTATGVATSTVTPAVTAPPTRTPRPTATPLALPPTATPTASPTPVQQP